MAETKKPTATQGGRRSLMADRTALLSRVRSGIGMGVVVPDNRVQLIELQQQIVDRTELGLGDVVGIQQLVQPLAPIGRGQNGSAQIPA
jgi:hypothetical protein